MCLVSGPSRVSGLRAFSGSNLWLSCASRPLSWSLKVSAVVKSQWSWSASWFVALERSTEAGSPQHTDSIWTKGPWKTPPPLKKKTPQKKAPTKRKKPKKGKGQKKHKKAEKKKTQNGKGQRKHKKGKKKAPKKRPPKRAPPKIRVQGKGSTTKKRPPKQKGPKQRAPKIKGQNKGPPQKKKQKGGKKGAQKKGPKKKAPHTQKKAKKGKRGHWKKTPKKGPEKGHIGQKKLKKAPKRPQKRLRIFFASTENFPCPIAHDNSRIRGTYIRNCLGIIFSLGRLHAHQLHKKRSGNYLRNRFGMCGTLAWEGPDRRGCGQRKTVIPWSLVALDKGIGPLSVVVLLLTPCRGALSGEND